MLTALLLLSLANHHTKAAAPAASDSAQAPAADGQRPEPKLHWKVGPQQLALGHDLTMALPDTDVFLAPPEAGQLMEKMGNLHNDNLLGVVMAKDEKQSWIVTIRYFDEGYIADDDKIDTDGLFKSIQEGTEAGNKERQDKGFPALHIQSWTEEPRYEKDVHHLVWGLLAKSDAEGDQGTVNFNTRVLGRKGYASLNLLTAPEALAADKPAVAQLLNVTSFDPGARYEDYNKATDKKAEYGLAGLILGGGGLMLAAKAGLFGKFILPILLAAKKLIIVIFAGGAAWLRRIFGKKNQALPPIPPTSPPPPAA